MQPPRLRTDRLLLREFRPEDVEPHAEMSQDEEVQRFLGGLKTPYDAFNNLATHAGHWALRGYGGFVIERREDGAFLGRTGFINPPSWPGLEVGWKLTRGAWGHGYATEAARAVIAFGFTALDLPELCSLIVPDNTGSAAVARRLGYENAGPVETPFGIANRWVIRRGAAAAESPSFDESRGSTAERRASAERPDSADRPNSAERRDSGNRPASAAGDLRGDPWAFRRATVDDAARLGVNLRAAMARFRDISPPGWTALEVPDGELITMLANPDGRCVLSEPGGVLAGHVAWRPSVGARRGPQDPAAAYLSQLYVEPGWWGSPLATRLMDFAFDGARADGFTRIHLVTPAAAGRARRFYERVGFHTTTPAAEDLRFGMPTVEYARDL
jgi:RimJ/RimL family protein N-acetyltransferase